MLILDSDDLTHLLPLRILLYISFPLLSEPPPCLAASLPLFGKSLV